MTCFFIGLIVGGCIGLVIGCLAVVAKSADREIERLTKELKSK